MKIENKFNSFVNYDLGSIEGTREELTAIRNAIDKVLKDSHDDKRRHTIGIKFEDENEVKGLTIVKIQGS